MSYSGLLKFIMAVPNPWDSIQPCCHLMITQKPEQILLALDAAASSFLANNNSRMRRKGSDYLNLFDIVKIFLLLQCSWWRGIWYVRKLLLKNIRLTFIRSKISHSSSSFSFLEKTCKSHELLAIFKFRNCAQVWSALKEVQILSPWGKGKAAWVHSFDYL